MAAPVRYLCLSDLHLGAQTCLLTDMEPDRVEPAASDVLLELVACLRSVVSANGGVKPTLILLGDALEFALAPDEISAMGFQRFAELTMAPGDELFDAIWFVPGNHDHHLWEAARETQYASYVGRHDMALPLDPPWHSTRMLHEEDPYGVGSPLLTALLRRARGGSTRTDTAAGASSETAASLPVVSAIYPNLALARGDRCIALHHGHFIEPAYSLMTSLNRIAFQVDPPAHVGDLEADNFAWIDFMWSALARSGSAGASVRYIYDHIQYIEDRKQLVDRLALGLAHAWKNATWLDGVEDAAQDWLIRTALEALAENVNSMGRRAYYGGHDGSATEDIGLTSYLETYVVEQLSREFKGGLPNDVTFVYGHTHHPREVARLPIAGLSRGVDVYNTGGWVHETKGREPLVGASMVLIDDDLEVASLRLYNETDDLARNRVEAHLALPAAEASSPLIAHARRMLASDPGPWARLVRAVDAAIG